MKSTSSSNYLKTLTRAVKIVFQSAPFDVTRAVVVALISGISPAVTLFLTKNIVDILTKIISSPSGLNAATYSSEINRVYILLALMLSTTIVVDALFPSENMLFPNIEDKVQGNVKSLLMKKISEFKDILIFESPETLNLLKLAERGIRNLTELIYLSFNSLDGLLRLIPSVLVSITIAWWIPFMLILASIPYLLIESRYRFISWSVEETQAESIRQLDIYSNILFSEIFAKEIRALSLQNLILEKWIELYSTTYGKMYAIRLKGAFLTFVSSCFEGLGAVIPYIMLVSGVINRSYTIGDLVLFSGLIFQVRTGIRQFLGSYNRLFSGALSVKPIFQFLDFKLFLAEDYPSSSGETLEPYDGITISNLNFAYPGAKKLAIKDVNFTISPGQTVVLVGENGSGKSTLAKLICRFYDPLSGSITWNGENIQSLSIDELRASMAVVFQDFARFPASVKENIGWANLTKLEDTEFIENLLKKIKLFDFFQEQDGSETLLTKLFDGGTDLSGGQWQRIAIARALARIHTVQLLILDEPTAAIDPENEHDIYNLIREMSANCMTIIISHRLGMARFSDRIFVLDDGMIIEEGTHEELMQKSGKYSDMFTKQMSQYI